MRTQGNYHLGAIGEDITADEVLVSEAPVSGWAVESSGPETVALDLELTGELRRLGLLREVIRIVQDARKNAGFDVSDRITLHWTVGGSPEPAQAIREHQSELSREVLATTLVEGAPEHPDEQPDGFFQAGDDELGLQLWLSRI